MINKFHPFPNNAELTELINDRKFKITAAEYRSVLEEMNNLLEATKENTAKYAKFAKEAEDRPLKSPKLLIEVISGHDISLTKWKKTPFVEVIQNDRGLMKSFHGTMNVSDRFDSMQDNSINTSFGGPTRDTMDTQNNLVLSTDIPVYPNEEGDFEW